MLSSPFTLNSVTRVNLTVSLYQCHCYKLQAIKSKCPEPNHKSAFGNRKCLPLCCNGLSREPFEYWIMARLWNVTVLFCLHQHFIHTVALRHPYKKFTSVCSVNAFILDDPSFSLLQTLFTLLFTSSGHNSCSPLSTFPIVRTCPIVAWASLVTHYFFDLPPSFRNVILWTVLHLPFPFAHMGPKHWDSFLPWSSLPTSPVQWLTILTKYRSSLLLPPVIQHALVSDIASEYPVTLFPVIHAK